MKGRYFFSGLTAACIVMATPQLAIAAGEYPIDPGDYVEISMIKIDDGHFLDYAKHLAAKWRDSAEYAKAQGWISNYQIWTNEYSREGEADIYLITWKPKLTDAAESLRRREAFLKHSKQTEVQMEAESGSRAEYRHLAGSMLMRMQTWSK